MWVNAAAAMVPALTMHMVRSLGSMKAHACMTMMTEDATPMFTNVIAEKEIPCTHTIRMLSPVKQCASTRGAMVENATSMKMQTTRYRPW